MSNCAQTNQRGRLHQTTTNTSIRRQYLSYTAYQQSSFQLLHLIIDFLYMSPFLSRQCATFCRPFLGCKAQSALASTSVTIIQITPFRVASRRFSHLSKQKTPPRKSASNRSRVSRPNYFRRPRIVDAQPLQQAVPIEVSM